MLCQSDVAVFLPIGVIGYACFQDCVEHREKLTGYGDQYVHFRFTILNPALEVDTISGHYSNGPYGKYPDESSSKSES